MELTPRVIRGDAKDLPLDEESVHCVVTSPPYWGLRAYGGDPGMIGLEPTLDEHLDNLVQVFREVRRVLRDDGTLWLNYGDAYAGSGKGHWNKDGEESDYNRGNPHASYGHTVKADVDNLKPKDLMLLPARVAMALQADGWWLRSEIVWHKPNPMPESVTDRPTSAHEKVFLLSKKARYFYDADAVRMKSNGWNGKDKPTHAPEHGENQGKSQRNEAATANLRNVWSIPTQGYSGAHFATFPLALAKRCILAGTSEKGVCSECGMPWVREVEMTPEYRAVLESGKAWRDDTGKPDGLTNRHPSKHPSQVPTKHITTGWHPTCACVIGSRGKRGTERIPATVFDPFGGSGTVGIAAEQLGRRSILNEINEDYCTMAQDRINNTQPMMAYA